MATDTTKTDTTDKTEDAGAAPETEREETAAVNEPAETGSAHADDDLDVVAADRTGEARRGGFGAGAAAVVSAALGLCSLTGTSLSEMLRERKQLIGQIESSAQPPAGGSGGDQISALYGAPWHATALFNGLFALLAVVVGGVLLAVVAKRADTGSWVKSVALGGLVLGLIGLLVAGGMYFDLFASPPEVPGPAS